MEIINLTPHKVCLENENTEKVIFEPSGKVMRANFDIEKYGTIYDRASGKELDVMRKKYTSINDSDIIIEPYKIYIVSLEVLKAMKELNYPNSIQFVAPDSSKANRVGDTIISVERFVVL